MVCFHSFLSMFTGGYLNPPDQWFLFGFSTSTGHPPCQPRQGHPPPSQARTAFELPSHLPAATRHPEVEVQHSSCPANVSLKEPIDPRIFATCKVQKQNTWQSQCLAARIINTVTAGFYIVSESERRNGARLLTPSLPS